MAAVWRSPARLSRWPSGIRLRGTDMEKVSGIGGLFFRARDPVAVGQWYRDHLGVALVPVQLLGVALVARSRANGICPVP
jgi:hypothetical protein